MVRPGGAVTLILGGYQLFHHFPSFLFQLLIICLIHSLRVKLCVEIYRSEAGLFHVSRWNSIPYSSSKGLYFKVRSSHLGASGVQEVLQPLCLGLNVMCKVGGKGTTHLIINLSVPNWTEAALHVHSPPTHPKVLDGSLITTLEYSTPAKAVMAYTAWKIIVQSLRTWVSA